MVERKELGQTEAPDELVPGKPEPLHRNAQALHDRARDVIADGEALRRIDTGGWTGPAHDAYAEDSANQWPKWLKLGDALEHGAKAVEHYATTLGWAQRQAVQAVEEYRQGEQLSRQAHAAHEQAVAHADAQSRANAQHGAPPVQAPAWNDPGEEHRKAAREILDRARAQLEQVAGETAQVLGDLAGAVPTEDEESTAETLTHAAADVIGFFPVVGDAVDLAHAGVYALQGKGLDAGITAAAAVPFGGWGAGAAKVGKTGEKLAKTGKEADEAAEAATKAGKAAEESTHVRGGPLPKAQDLIDKGQPWTGTGRRGGQLPRTDGPPSGVYYRKDPQSGKVTNYAVYDENGKIIKRVDLEGRSHGGVDTPHVTEYQLNRNPNTGQEYPGEVKGDDNPRRAKADEIP